MFSNSAALNALDVCPEDADKVVIAGREILKILDLRDGIKQIMNLRSGKLNINWNHVKWSASYSKQVLVTGAANGSIVVWNLALNSAQKIERIITEHSRAVNKISLHPQESYILISASQDGTMKLWDLRTKNTARHTFEGKSEAVRDVCFSPMNSYEFAAAFENGNIQKWDLRNPTFYERKWSAHNGLALSVDWHPYGRVLASGGRDRILKMWDIKSDSRKPFHSIQTIAPVSCIQWRPGYETHIGYCSLSNDFRIQLYDICTPFVPLATLNSHENVVSGFLWKDSDTLYSCSKDCTFRIHSFDVDGTSPGDLLSDSCMAFNSHGNLTFSLGYDNKNQDVKTIKKASKRSVFNRWDDKSPIAVRINKPNQIYAFMDTETFDLRGFIFFAENFKTDSTDISAACDHNSKVCDEMGHAQVANNWRLLKTLFYKSPVQVSIMEAESQSLNALNILMSIIYYYAETCNPQMCVTLYLLFSGISQFKTYCKDKVRVWYDSYLDLLFRNSLFNTATLYIKSSNIDSIQELHQESFFSLLCSVCGKMLKNSRCDSCFHRIKCVLCHLLVDGQVILCPGCHHGGHLLCIQNWFQKFDQCPCGNKVVDN